MTVSATGSATSSQTTQNPNKTLGKEEFLKLLITELRYQDPTKPMDDREFISQMAQFSALEQMQNLNTSFENLKNSFETLNISVVEGLQALTYQLVLNGMYDGLNLLGKEVSYLDENDETKTGTIEALKPKGTYYVAVINGEEVELSRINQIKK